MLLHLVGILSSRFAHDARSQEHKDLDSNLTPGICVLLNLSTKIHGIPSNRTVIFKLTAVRTSNPHSHIYPTSVLFNGGYSTDGLID